jgi:hypothetical protein
MEMIRMLFSIQNVSYLLSLMDLMTADGPGPLSRQLRGFELDKTGYRTRSSRDFDSNH